MKGAADPVSFPWNVSVFPFGSKYRKKTRCLPDSLAWKLLELSEVKTEGKKLHLLPSQRKWSCAPSASTSWTHTQGQASHTWWCCASARHQHHGLMKREAIIPPLPSTAWPSWGVPQVHGLHIPSHPLPGGDAMELPLRQGLSSSPPSQAGLGGSPQNKGLGNPAWVITISRIWLLTDEWAQQLTVVCCVALPSQTPSNKTRHLFSPGEEQQSCLSLGIDSALKVEPEHMAPL